MGWLHRFRGTLYLGYRALLAHPFRKLLRPDPRAARERFLANYAPEGNVPTSLEERVLLKRAGRCIHCGLCDAVCPRLTDLPRIKDAWPSALPAAYALSAADLPWQRELVERLKPELLTQAQAVCPTRVPLVALADYLRRKLAAIDAHRAAARTTQH